MSEHRGSRPSLGPVAVALGVSIACAGAITHWAVLVGGVLLVAAALVGWVADMLRSA